VDPMGAAVPGVTVTLTNTTTGRVQTTVTDANGLYGFSLLAPGTYEVDFSAGGFKRSTEMSVIVNVSEEPELDAQLEAGASEERVTCRCQLSQTATSSSGTLVDSKTDRTVVSQSKIESLEPSPVSLMPESILDPVWVNSRGAIPRFDRGSIEIRIMDIQECPSADMAIITLVIDLLHALVNEKFVIMEDQTKIKTDLLVSIFDRCLVSGRNTIIEPGDYLKIFDIEKPISVGELWKIILKRLIFLTPSLKKNLVWAGSSGLRRGRGVSSKVGRIAFSLPRLRGLRLSRSLGLRMRSSVPMILSARRSCFAMDI